MTNEKKLAQPFEIINMMNDYINSNENEAKSVDSCVVYLESLSNRKFYIDNLTESQKQQIQQSIQNGKNYLNQSN